MGKTIALRIKITELTIRPVEQTIMVRWIYEGPDGTQFGRENLEVYWVTMPPNPGPTDVQLPAKYIAMATTLYADAQAALDAKYLTNN